MYSGIYEVRQMKINESTNNKHYIVRCVRDKSDVDFAVCQSEYHNTFVNTILNKCVPRLQLIHKYLYTGSKNLFTH